MSGRARGWTEYVFLLALLVRGALLVAERGTATEDWYRWSETDSRTYLDVASQIAAGDLLVEEPAFASHGWHALIAPHETWRRWIGLHSFYQVPGYYYFLALCGLAGPMPVVARIVQVLLGALNCVVLALLGEQLGGRAAGWATGLLAAFCGLFAVYESLVLREGLGLVTANLALLAVAANLRGAPTVRRWFGAGVLLGVAALVKESGNVLFLGVACFVALVSLRDRQARPLVGLVAGFGLTLAPLFVRNAIVGAPLFQLSSPFKIGLAIAFALTSDATADGVVTNGPSLYRIVAAADGDVGKIRELALATFHGPLEIARGFAHRFTALFRDAEVPDNYSYELAVLEVPAVAALLRFAATWQLALLGILVAPFRARAIDTRLAVLLVWCFALQAMAQLPFNIVGRYRLVLVPYLIVFAGWTCAVVWTWLRERRYAHVLASLGALLAMKGIWALVPPDRAIAPYLLRPVDIEVAAGLLADRGNLLAAHELYEAGRRVIPDKGFELSVAEVELVVHAGRPDLVAAQWKELAAAHPDDPRVQALAPAFR